MSTYTVTVFESDPDLLLRLQLALSPKEQDKVVGEVALKAYGDLVKATPVAKLGAFGQTRRAWQVINAGVGARIVRNESKVMVWLEDGTKAHGPVNAKALFIPLTNKAAQTHMETQANGSGWSNVGGKLRGSRNGKKSDLVYGVDYVLAKRVKGIKALKIVEHERAVTVTMLRDAMTLHLRKAMHG